MARLDEHIKDLQNKLNTYTHELERYGPKGTEVTKSQLKVIRTSITHLQAQKDKIDVINNKADDFVNGLYDQRILIDWLR